METQNEQAQQKPSRKALLLAARWIPPDSQAVEHPEGLGVVYIHKGGRSAIAYRGNAAKSAWHYSFRTPEQRDAHIKQWFEGLSAHEQRKADYRRELTTPHTLKPGDVVCNSWGYDQTNIDFFEVVSATAHFVWLRQLKQQTTEQGFMAGPTIPLLGQYRDEEITKHAASSGKYGNRVNFKHGSGYKWDGKPEHCTWYA